MLFVITFLILLKNKSAPAIDAAIEQDCMREYVYQAKNRDVYIRGKPGKSASNPPLYTVKKKEKICFTSKIHMYTEESGVQTPWISVRSMGSNRVEGWANRCLFDGKPINASYETRC